MTTQEKLKELFDYHGTGALIEKTKRYRRCKIGYINNGNISSNKYMVIGIDNKKYLIHRMIFLWHHGYLPKLIDHIDRNTRNNKIENLRHATMSLNMANRKINNNNTSGFKGVHFEKKINKYVSHIAYNNKSIYLGSYNNREEAAKAYDKKAKELYGDFAQLNFPSRM